MVAPISRPTVAKLPGSVSNIGANEGLSVSWSGFKDNVQEELAGRFFRVTLWSETQLPDAPYQVYDNIDPDLRAELPLKQMWAVAMTDEEGDD